MVHLKRVVVPLVSVIITTKNEEANIARCLDSVKAQSFSDLEIIVVDNSSEDRTKEISLQYTDKVFNKGPERSSQRNYGVEVCQGKYILYLDADMAISADVVKECVDICNNDPLVSGLYVPEIVVGAGFWIDVRNFERSFYDGTCIDAVRFMPKEVFTGLGGFDLSLCGPEDWDLNKRVSQKGKTKVIKSSLYHDEGAFELADYLKKKTYYATDFKTYINKWGSNDPDVKKQLGALYRFFGVFVEKGKFIRLLMHPFLTFGMYYLRFRVGLAYLSVKKAQKLV